MHRHAKCVQPIVVSIFSRCQCHTACHRSSELPMLPEFQHSIVPPTVQKCHSNWFADLMEISTVQCVSLRCWTAGKYIFGFLFHCEQSIHYDPYLERRKNQSNQCQWNDANNDCHGVKNWPLATRNDWLASLNHRKRTICVELIRKHTNRNAI